MDEPTTRRLFFALWPGRRNREAIYQVARALKKQCGGRLVNLENLHLTLAFVGPVTEQQQQCMENIASHIHVPAFTLTLSELGFWPQPKVAWLAPRQIPVALQQLAASLNTRLQECGYEADTRDYQAHITLLRKARSDPDDKQTRDITWQVDRFALVESLTHAEGVEYRVLAEWPLD